MAGEFTYRGEAMPITVSEQGDVVTIFIAGRFDFSLHREFADAYQPYPKGVKRYVVDLSGVDYMDSSAMGMLLQLRDHSLKGDKEAIVLANPSDGVADILRIANFEKLFTVQ
jgi:anti-anti-sigma factor